jgi:hypothetical protein
MQNRKTVHQVICHNAPRQDIDSLKHTIDFSNIAFSGIGERTVYGQQETDSMSAMKDKGSKAKECQDRGHDLVKQFHEDRIFNKKLEPNTIAAKDAEDAKLLAVREEGSQQERVGHIISHVEPDHE